jgi:hypothetical protein
MPFCGLYYKHVTIVNYASSSVNKFRASLNDIARVAIYDRHMFILEATGVSITKLLFLITDKLARGFVPDNYSFLSTIWNLG